MEPTDTPTPEPSGIDALLAILKSSEQAQIEADDPKNIKYVVYTRKSTVGEGRQERSIGDQVKDCYDRIIKPLEIAVEQNDIIRERGSAKEPDTRPQFKQMVEDLRRGKYQGIIAWHPDRLARNMKEAGEIIDMLDKKVIKDLRFATSTFENNPTGKMLLGISFVLSKQYSEHLSETIIRGNERGTESGRYFGKFKHGYLLLDNRQLIPDDENFALIQQAFRMRLDNRKQEDIADYLNDNNYKVFKRVSGHSTYRFDKDKVSKLLKDPVNAGILVYGDGITKLSDHYDFTPVIDPDDFLKINNAKDFMSKQFKMAQRAPSPGVKSDFLRGYVRCGYCNKNMSTSVVKKKLNNGERRYFYYRCDNKACEYYGKNERAKIVLDFVLQFLKDYQFTTRSNYDRYKVDAQASLKRKDRELSGLIGSLTKQIGDKKQYLERIKPIVADENHPMRPFYVDDLATTTQAIKDLEDKLSKANAAKKAGSRAIKSYAEFLELWQNASKKLGSTSSLAQLDFAIKKMFLNFTLKDHAVSVYELREPFAEFLKTDDFERGRGDRT